MMMMRVPLPGERKGERDIINVGKIKVATHPFS